jgi:hypothetical protein
MEEPVRPPIITLVTTLTWPNPPRRCPTSEVANLIRRSVMPVMFMIPPVRMKKGIARRMKESNAEVRFWDTVSIIRSPWGEIATKAQNAKVNPTGTPSRSSTSVQTRSAADGGKPTRYVVLKFLTARYRSRPITSVKTALRGYLMPGRRSRPR